MPQERLGGERDGAWPQGCVCVCGRALWKAPRGPLGSLTGQKCTCCVAVSVSRDGCHELPHTCWVILSLLGKPGVRNQLHRLKLRSCQAMFPLRCSGRGILLTSPSFWWPLAFFSLWLHLSLFHLRVCPRCLHLSLMRMHVIAVRTHLDNPG